MRDYLCCLAPIGAIAGLLAAWGPMCEARVTSIAIDSTNSVTGASIPYETILGRAFGELDPKDSHNSIIQDISLAPQDAEGKVRYIATFQITTPVNPAQRNGLLIYEVSNRGHNAIPAASALVSGATYLQSGWQGDLLANCTKPYPCTSLAVPYSGTPAQVIQVPVAHRPDGSAITGPVYGRIANAKGSTAQMIIFTTPVPYKPLSMDTAKSRFWSVASQTTTGVDGPKTPIASSDWAWADCRTAPFPGTPDPTRICLKHGFNPNLLYEMVFTAKDPLVLGVGFAATRDIISFFHHGRADDRGTANPVAGQISKVISIGTSQSGAFIRASLFYGFNQDENGQQVVDGAWSNIDGRMLFMNVRFALPDVLLGLYMMGDEAPVWWADYPNEARNLPAAGLLDRCKASKTCPQILETFGSLEFYSEKMAADLIGMTADADIPLPPDVHRYYHPGTTHGGGRGGFTYVANPPPAKGCTLPANPNPESNTNNALLDDFIDLIMNGTPMPPSVYPKLSRGQIVPATKAGEGFPTIPGYPFGGNRLWRIFKYDFGPKLDYSNQTGFATIQPPIVDKVLPAYAVKVNSDGNEVAGVPSVLFQAPLGTYSGWNITAYGFYKGQQCGLSGSYYPFKVTKAERVAAKDPRPSLEERYGTHAGYVCVVKAAARKNVKERFLRTSAASRLIGQAQESNVLRGITPTAAGRKVAQSLCSALDSR